MKVRYIVDVEVNDKNGDDVWLGQELRSLAERWGTLLNERIGVILVEPENTTAEEFTRVMKPHWTDEHWKKIRREFGLSEEK